jgi:hypothetical protein
MGMPKRRKGADEQAGFVKTESSHHREGMPHANDGWAQEGPNFTVTAEAEIPKMEKSIALPEALLLALPDVYDTKSSAKKVLREAASSRSLN